jgi:hypothetical protein
MAWLCDSTVPPSVMNVKHHIYGIWHFCRYARYGDVSPKVDVYAFGVVLYELISAKDAIVRSTESSSDSKGLVYLVINSFTFCSWGKDQWSS